MNEQNEQNDIQMEAGLRDLDERLRAAGRPVREGAAGVSPSFSRQLQRRLEEEDLRDSRLSGEARVFEAGRIHRPLARRLLIAAAVLSFVALGAFAAVRRAPVGAVLYAQGETEGRKAERSLRRGEAIETGSKRLVAQLDERVHLLISESTVLAIESPDRIRLDQGEVYVHVVPGSGKFRVVTAHSSEVDVLGTSYLVRTSSEGDYVATYSGAVRFAGPGGEALVRAGSEGTRPTEQRAPAVTAAAQSEPPPWAEELYQEMQRRAASAFFPSAVPLGGDRQSK